MTCQGSDRILQSIRVRVPGATDDLIQLELFNMADEFFRRTNTWTVDESIDMEEGVYEYQLATPPNATVVRMMAVSHNGVPVGQASQTAAIMSGIGRLPSDLTFPDQDAVFFPDKSDIESNLFNYALYRPDYITVTTSDAQTIKYPLMVTYAMSVSRGCLECDCGDWDIPDWMWDMFFQDWLDGTLGRLYEMPSKPWTSEKNAAYHLKRFRKRLAFRKQESTKGFVYGGTRWRFPRATM